MIELLSLEESTLLLSAFVIAFAFMFKLAIPMLLLFVDEDEFLGTLPREPDRRRVSRDLLRRRSLLSRLFTVIRGIL